MSADLEANAREQYDDDLDDLEAALLEKARSARAALVVAEERAQRAEAERRREQIDFMVAVGVRDEQLAAERARADQLQQRIDATHTIADHAWSATPPYSTVQLETALWNVRTALEVGVGEPVPEAKVTP